MAHVANHSGNNKGYTPAEYIAASRATMAALAASAVLWGCAAGAAVPIMSGGMLQGVPPVPFAAAKPDVQAMKAALEAFKRDDKVKPVYAWDHRYCLRYLSKTPNLLIIGDGDFDGWSGYLLHEFPRAVVDARVGRRFSRGLVDYRKLSSYPALRKINRIVLELGGEGSVTHRQVRQMLSETGQYTVYWITPGVPRSGRRQVLATAKWAAGHYPNLHLVHWRWLAARNPQYFWKGSAVPNWAGIQSEVSLLKVTIDRGTASRKADLKPVVRPDIAVAPTKLAASTK